MGGIDSVAIPGASITYKIECSNSSGTIANNVIIFDELSTFVIYKTNSGNSGGWIMEFSTNISPDQSYGSIDYTNLQPPVSKIRWIKWKKATVNPGEAGKFSFTVIIR